MVIRFDEVALAKQLMCAQIELNNKPVLMPKSVESGLNMIVAVDMINGFCTEGALASPRCGAVAGAIARVMDRLPAAQRVFVRDCHTEGSAEFKWFPPHCHTKKESRVVDALKGYQGVDVPKNSTNGFPALLMAVPNITQYKNVLITGVCTDICVLQLALSLRAYINEQNAATNVIVLTDCVDTYDSPVHNADYSNMVALKLMEQSGVQIFKNI